MDEEKAKAEKVAAAKKKVQHSLPLPFHCHSTAIPTCHVLTARDNN